MRQGLESIRFLYDGERINGAQTASELDMENGATIDAMIQQVGGNI